MESQRLTTLITGASGFLGSHLWARLKAEGRDKVFALARSDGADMHRCNLCNKSEVLQLLGSIKPTKIFHCAGAFTNNIAQDFGSNVLPTTHLLEAINELKLTCRLVLIGSAAEYGVPDSDTGQISENHDLRPVSIYGLSKVLQAHIMEYFYRVSESDVLMARLFNLDGEGVSPYLFPGHVRTEIKKYLDGTKNAIHVGDLSAYRDFLSVNDAVSDLLTIMEHGLKGEIYNVGSGIPVQMKQLLNALLEEYNICSTALHIDKDRVSPSGKISIIYADISKLNRLKETC